MKIEIVLVGSLSKLGAETAVAEDRHETAGIGCRSDEHPSRAGGRLPRDADLRREGRRDPGHGPAGAGSGELILSQEVGRRVILDLDIGIVFLRLRRIAMQ